MLVDGASGLAARGGAELLDYRHAGVGGEPAAGHNRVKLSYASGDALVMQALAKPEDRAAILQGRMPAVRRCIRWRFRARMRGLGTRWRASYRWQPESTVTEVAPFAVDAASLI
jgi:hypothetical protein